MERELLNNINYNHIYYFWIIAKEGSIKGASEKLHLSQSTLSDQLRVLEDRLGKKLFLRRTRGLELNEAGKKILKYANKIFPLGEELFDSLRRGDINETITVQVGIVPSVSKSFVYKAILPLIKNPKIKVRVIEAEYKYLYSEIHVGNIDVILCDNISKGMSSYISAIELKKRRFCAVCAPDLLTEEKFQFPQVLDDMPFMNYTDNIPAYDQIHSFLDKNSLSPWEIGELDDTYLIKLVTENGLCFSILPYDSLEQSLQKGKLIILGEVEDIKSQLYAVYQSDRIEDQLLEIIHSLQGNI
jgi:LysR family transcriptional activator of nhaA